MSKSNKTVSAATFSVDTVDAPDYLRRFLMMKLATEGKTRQTAFTYYVNLRLFFRWMIMKQGARVPFDDIQIYTLELKDVCAVTAMDINSFLQFCKMERDNAASQSIATKLSAIREFYEYLIVMERVLTVNPAARIRPPKRERKVPRYLTQQECRTLLDNIGGNTPCRDHCMILWTIHAGLRLSELVGVNTDDINVADQRLLVRGKGNKERYVFFDAECMVALKNYLEERLTYDAKPQDKALFIAKTTGNRLSPRRVQQIVEQHLLAAGLEGKGISPHKLRHTAATNLLHDGVDIRTIQELLGHESLATTQIYTHLTDRELAESMKRSHIATESGDTAQSES